MSFRPISCALLALTTVALAQKPKAALPAVPAKPAQPAERAKAAPGIISSEMGGKDMVFIANARDLGKALQYLAAQAAGVENRVLKNADEELARTLTAHGAVVDTLAEMRNLKPLAESPTEKRIVEKLTKLEGAKREKAMLDALIELDELLVATYQLGKQSGDVTITKFVEQALPQAEQHLHLVQSMAGIAPKRRVAQIAPKPAEVAAHTTAPEAKASDAPAVKEPAKSEPAKESPALAELPPLPKAEPKRMVAPRLPEKPDPIAEPPADAVGPKKFEGEAPKPAKRPSFRTNVKPLTE